MKTAVRLAPCLLLVSALADAAENEGAAPWPTSPSAAPTVAAWKAAQPVTLPRVYGSHAKACEVRRIAEWLNVRCVDKTSAVTQLGGDRTDVSYYVNPPGADRISAAGQATFPLRTGDRRVILFWSLGPGYDGPLTVVPSVVLQASWLKGQDTPYISLTDALHEPVATKTHPRVPFAKEH